MKKASRPVGVAPAPETVAVKVTDSPKTLCCCEDVVTVVVGVRGVVTGVVVEAKLSAGLVSSGLARLAVIVRVTAASVVVLVTSVTVSKVP